MIILFRRGLGLVCRKANRAPPNVSSTLKYPFDYMLSVLTVNSNLFPDFCECDHPFQKRFGFGVQEGKQSATKCIQYS